MSLSLLSKWQLSTPDEFWWGIDSTLKNTSALFLTQKISINQKNIKYYLTKKMQPTNPHQLRITTTHGFYSPSPGGIIYYPNRANVIARLQSNSDLDSPNPSKAPNLNPSKAPNIHLHHPCLKISECLRSNWNFQTRRLLNFSHANSILSQRYQRFMRKFWKIWNQASIYLYKRIKKLCGIFKSRFVKQSGTCWKQSWNQWKMRQTYDWPIRYLSMLHQYTYIVE